MDAQVADPLPGTLVDGRYRVRDLIARADGTAWYSAVDERLDRRVGLMFAAPGHSGVADLGEEAEALARLAHPHTIDVYGHGWHAGAPYLVVEQVTTVTLRDVLARRFRLPVAETLAVVEQVLAGVAAAHRAGFTHGELTSGRVLVLPSPTGGTDDLTDAVVKVTGFGVLRSLPTPVDLARERAAYTAPEVVREGHLSPAADVYAVGVLLFELLTGQLPPPADTYGWPASLPPPSRYAPGVPEAVDELVRRATDPDPATRITATALLAAIPSVRERATARLPVADNAAADATMVINTVVEERPAWARLPSHRSARRTAPPTRGTVVRTRPLRRSRPLLITVAVAGVLVLLTTWWVAVGRFQPAPNLVGLTEEEAVTVAQRAGLSVTFTDPRHSDTVPAGHVLAQQPPQDGRVPRGGTIVLTLSLGPRILLVPDVLGSETEVAVRQLTALGLVVVEGETEYSDTVPEGRVLALDPPPGTEVVPGTEIVVTVSRGKAPIEVPALIGLQEDEARLRLITMNLVPEVVEVESGRPKGQVVQQDPAPGAGVEPGHTVRLEVSKGPPTVPVPNVENLPCMVAEQVLRQAGFEVRRFGAGPVRDQNPDAGTGLPPGETVVIVCG